jgi:glycosyltransferase involved in cell wall biosynthesis
MIMKNDFKISICTVCMNRLYHLKETLLRNIEDNRDYKNLEHVILDYNSRDGMETWAKEHLGKYIQNGRVKYYRTTDPENFNMAHSKNMVARLAEGEIICLTDADNFTGRNYAKYVDATFYKRYPDRSVSQSRNDVFMTTIGARKTTNPTDVLGRVCCWKDDFLAVRGFDEFMNNYGFDDHDFANRLALLGRHRIVMTSKQYLCAISHSLGERISNQRTREDIEDIYIHHIDPAKTELLFLFSGDRYHFGIVRDNQAGDVLRAGNPFARKNAAYAARNYTYKESLTTTDWIQGIWEKSTSGLTLHPERGRPVRYTMFPGSDMICTLKKEDHFWKIKNENMITELLLFHSILRNRNKMVSNKRSRQPAVNHSGYGCGKVYRNFNYSRSIYLQQDE